MAPFLEVLVLGALGGAIVALIVVLQGRRYSPPPLDPLRHLPISTNIINMASIRVAGVGGLGLVAMAAAVALDVPRIGQTVALGFVLGIAAAAVMIVRRRGSGAMPSSGQRMGANTVLSIDAPAAADDSTPDDTLRAVSLVPAR